MKISNKFLKKSGRLISFFLSSVLLCSCQKVNMDFLIDNDNKDFYIPFDAESDSHINIDRPNSEKVLLPIQFINVDDNKVIEDETDTSSDTDLNSEQTVITGESSADYEHNLDQNKQSNNSSDKNNSEKESKETETGSGAENSSDPNSDGANLKPQTMPLAGKADLKSIKGEYYDKWSEDLICQILPVSDSQNLEKRPLNENALLGVEVFIDAGTFSSRENYTVTYGEERINEKDLYIDIAKMAAYSLESMGAKVVILGNDDAKDIHEFARIFTAGSYIIREIKKAYSKVNNPNPLMIKTLDQYLSKINTIILKNDDKGNMIIDKSPRSFVQGSGANLEERYYLDLMSRLDHVVYIQLKLSTDEESKEAGYQVTYLSNKEAYRADQFNAQYYSNLDPNEYYPEQPSYQMYDDRKRMKLAKCLDLTMQQYCQSLNNKLAKRKIDWNDNYEYKDYTAEADSRAGRHLNIPVVTLKLGNVNNKADSEALVKDIERYLVSKAITHAVYKYFCQ